MIFRGQALSLSRRYYLKLITAMTALLLGPGSAAEPADTNYDEKKVPPYELPKLLVDKAGRLVGRGEWDSHRRAEVLQLFEESVYGKTPKRELKVRYEVIESNAKAFNGRATRKQIAAFFGEKEHRVDILLYVPNKAKTPVPAFLGLNFSGNHTVHSDPKIIRREVEKKKERARGSAASRWQAEMVIDSGYAFATMHRDQVDGDNYRSDFTDGIQPLFYAEGQKKPKPMEWGSIGAWAWGFSRVLDYLETDKLIDAKRVAVIGHSRLGKVALWAGAQDTRFALVISNNSGCGGAALYRRCYGERIHHMTRSVSYWFCSNHEQYQKRENDLPVDQHMLMALVAPRPLYVASATEDQWADPKGEFLAAKHAGPVYELFGKPSLSAHDMPKPDQPVHTTIGYHLRTGKHDVTAYDWQQYIKFSDRFLKN